MRRKMKRTRTPTANKVAALKADAIKVAQATIGGRTSELRALPVFNVLPAKHVTFLITEDGAEPHLRKGEYAVIDTTDRDLQHGELYVVQDGSGRRSRRLYQARADHLQLGTGTRKSLCWWLGDLRGYRRADDQGIGVPVFAGLSDGPYRTQDLQSKLVGRVVGLAFTALGDLLAPEAGFRDEQGGNAAFDAAEYLDVLIATGHEPSIQGKLYFEKMPDRPVSDQDWQAILKVRLKYVEASTALERVKQECIRQGLVDNRWAA